MYICEVSGILAEIRMKYKSALLEKVKVILQVIQKLSRLGVSLFTDYN